MQSNFGYLYTVSGVLKYVGTEIVVRIKFKSKAVNAFKFRAIFSSLLNHQLNRRIICFTTKLAIKFVIKFLDSLNGH